MMRTALMSLLLLLSFTSRLFAQAPTSRAASRVPDDVELRRVTIFSDGTRMVGNLYLPKELKENERLPAVVICAGTAGTKETSGTRLGPIFAHAGYVMLAFDYRGWGGSDSKLTLLEPMPKPDTNGEVTVHARAVRWQLDFADQVADIRAAIAFVAGEKHVDPKRIGIWGTSYGGGLVTWTAGNDPRVKCLVAQVPGMGVRTAESTRYAYELLGKQARGDVEAVPFETGKLGGKLATYSQMRANPAKSIGYNAIEAAGNIKSPTLIVVAEKEELLDNSQNGKKVFETIKANGVPAAYEVIPGISHYGVYQEAFDAATRLELDWMNKYLKVEGN